MWHLGAYLGPLLPDPTLLESRKGTPSTTARRRKPYGWSARAPNLGHRRCVMAPLLRPVSVPATSLAHSLGWRQRRGVEEKCARVMGEPRHTLVLMCRESHVTIHRRWTAHSASGQIRPRWANASVAQAFIALFFTPCGLERAVFSFWVEIESVFLFFLSFLFFFF
jgi:hypothetical protein